MASPAPNRFTRTSSQRPLPSLDVGARLNANQARDRFLSRPANDNASGAANDNAYALGADEPTFLDQGVRSYARPEETDVEEWRGVQAGMTRTRRQFLTPEGERATEAPAPTESAKRSARTGQEEAAEYADDSTAARQDRAAAENMALAAELDRDRRIEGRRRAAEEEREGQGVVQTVKKTVKGVRNVIKLIQIALAGTLLPIVTFFMQVSAEFFNKWFFKKEGLPLIGTTEKNPKIGFNDGLFGCGCFVLISLCLLSLVPLLILTFLVWGFTNPLDTISLGIDAIMGALFK